MTTLAHTGASFKPARYSSGGRTMAGTATANAHLPMIKRFWIGALTVLMAGGAIAGVIALKAAFYFSHFSH
jgi:hypothetical protein